MLRFASKGMGIFVFVVCMVLFLPMGEVWARKPDVAERFLKPLPEYPIVSDADFKAATTLYHSKPYGNPIFEYNIRIPKGWEVDDKNVSSNFLINDKLYTELSSFYSKPRVGGRSRIQIKTINLDFNLTAKEWFIKYLLESGYTTEAMVVHNDNKVEGMLIVMEDDVTYMLRAVVQINGDKVIAVESYVPSAYWEEEKSMQAKIISDFALVNQAPQFFPEVGSFQFLDVAELQYPRKWKLISKPARSVNKMSIKILNVRDNASDSHSAAEGNIDATLISNMESDNLISEIQAYKKDLESTGMIVGKKIDNVSDIKLKDKDLLILTDVYEGIDSTNEYIEYELWFTLIIAGNYYYFVTLLTPARSESYIAWAYNTEGYRSIIESFAPMAGAYIERAE